MPFTEESEILDEGQYCTDCGFFEVNVEFSGLICKSCGCKQNAHVFAQVVAVND